MSHPHDSITIGKSESGPLKLDVARLIKTRLLVTANSGGGKSWLLRRLFEELGQSTQVIVLDREGEFVTLREKLDIVLVGQQGEIPTDLRSAALLCRRLMEKHLSAVIDLSDLSLDHQRRYVKLFLDALIALPKELWRPCFIGLDETHLFCPEKGGTSGAESQEAVINLATLGRKRGFCPIFATQRISKFNKDAAAELLNKFIGRTTLDVDQKRAADELGMTTDQGRGLRDLSPPGQEGEFYAFGPALLTAGVTRIRVGKVSTTHPEAGQGRTLEPPKPSRAIAAVVAELADLPQQAQAEIKDMEAARARIAILEQELVTAHQGRGKPTREQLDQVAAAAVEKHRRKEAGHVAQLCKGLEDAMKLLRDIQSKEPVRAAVDPEKIRHAVESAVAQICRLTDQAVAEQNSELKKLKHDAGRVLAQLQKLFAVEPAANGDVNLKVDSTSTHPNPAPRPIQHTPAANPTGRHELTGTERAVLDAAATFPGGATKQRISIFSGRSNKSSSFDAAFAGGTCKDGKRPSLVQAGLIQKEGEKYLPTEAGRAMAEPTTATTLAGWKQKLNPSEAKVLQCIVDAYPNRLKRTDVAEQTGLSAKSSTFDAAFPALRELGLIEGKQDFAATEEIANAPKEES